MNDKEKSTIIMPDGSPATRPEPPKKEAPTLGEAWKEAMKSGDTKKMEEWSKKQENRTYDTSKPLSVGERKKRAWKGAVIGCFLTYIIQYIGVVILGMLFAPSREVYAAYVQDFNQSIFPTIAPVIAATLAWFQVYSRKYELKNRRWWK